MRADKESQFLAMSNIKFILLPGALPPGPPAGLCPCTPLGASAAPRPLTCVGAEGPHSCLLSKYHCLLQILLTALIISAKDVVRTESASTELTFPDIRYNHNTVNGLSLMKALVFKFKQLKSFKWPVHDRTGKLCTASTSSCPIQSLRKVS